MSTSMIKDEFIWTGFSNLQCSLKDSFDRGGMNESVYTVALNKRIFLDFGNLL